MGSEWSKKKCHSLLLQVCFEQMCTYFCNFLASTSPPPFFLCKNLLYKMINTKPDDQMQCYYLFTFIWYSSQQSLGLVFGMKGARESQVFQMQNQLGACVNKV